MSVLDDESRKVIHELRNTMHEFKVDSITRHMELENNVAVVHSKLESVDEKLSQMVTRPEFTPVKVVVYGMAGTILSGAIGALLTQIFVHTPK